MRQPSRRTAMGPFSNGTAAPVRGPPVPRCNPASNGSGPMARTVSCRSAAHRCGDNSAAQSAQTLSHISLTFLRARSLQPPCLIPACASPVRGADPCSFSLSCSGEPRDSITTAHHPDAARSCRGSAMTNHASHRVGLPSNGIAAARQIGAGCSTSVSGSVGVRLTMWTCIVARFLRSQAPHIFSSIVHK